LEVRGWRREERLRQAEKAEVKAKVELDESVGGWRGERFEVGS
jgi:hypothetical protein